MTIQLGSLRELQKLDVDIAAARRVVATFDPKIEVIEEPALDLESEVTRLRTRLQEVELDERRVELSADEKRARSKKLDERLTTVRNVREEAAVHAEIDMVRRSLEGAEQEALTLLDQIHRMEERLQESQEALEVAQAEVEPKRDELVGQREAAKIKLAGLESRRDAFASGINSSQRDTYERILAGGRTVAVADLTEDGACGNCFSVIPLQLRNQILHGNDMIRCEGCGVILTPPAAEESAAEESVVEEPAAEESVVQELAAEESAAEESVVEDPATEEAATEESVVEEPATEEAATEESVVEEPATEESATEESVVEEPATEEAATEESAAG